MFNNKKKHSKTSGRWYENAKFKIISTPFFLINTHVNKLARKKDADETFWKMPLRKTIRWILLNYKASRLIRLTAFLKKKLFLTLCLTYSASTAEEVKQKIYT